MAEFSPGKLSLGNTIFINDYGLLFDEQNTRNPLHANDRPCMNIERLNRIEEIHDAALQLSLAERSQFVREACGGDADLLDEVESLLAFAERSECFLDSLPEALAAEMLSELQIGTDLIGREISHYKVIKLLGSGGMGDVYLAEDLKLRRKT